MPFDNEAFHAYVRRAVMGQERLDPPETKHGSRDVIYQEALAEAMMGDGEFWASWDNDQSIRIMEAVRVALSLIGQGDAQCMRVIRNAVLTEAERYADWKARK